MLHLSFVFFNLYIAADQITYDGSRINISTNLLTICCSFMMIFNILRTIRTTLFYWEVY